MTGITRMAQAPSPAADATSGRARAVLALDVGGVQTKAALLELGDGGGGPVPRVASRPFEVWRDPDALTAVVREVAAAAGAQAVDGLLVALTVTAELSDAFATKREGVLFVLDAVERAVAPCPLVALTTAGALVPVDAARARPLEVAAANWIAPALLVAAEHDRALIVDVGSTTTDVVPVAGGRVAAGGRADLDRLLAGELVYTGALRTNLAALAERVTVRGRACPVASEQFAITADVHLILGHISADEYTCPTPDGRERTVEAARARVARLVCADLEQLGAGEVDAIAAFLHAEQVRRIAAAVEQVAARHAIAGPVVPLGAGAFLARAAAASAGLRVAAPPERLGPRGAEAAPAAALALLAAEAQR
jgi:probable H4MPT-linked C1 transfer pathway protein